MAVTLSPTTKTAEVRSTFGRKVLTFHYGGDYIDAGEILLDEPRHGHYDGIALRDALLEAFPLDPGPTDGSAYVKPSVVPGQVWQSTAIRRFSYTVLPDGKYYANNSGYVASTTEAWDRGYYDLVFDPRDAVALPSPLGIRVGDRVRRTEKVDGETRVVEFEVNHIGSETGFISTKYGRSYSPEGFEVTSREVPDRLPAGTITRVKVNGILCLRLEQGFINLRYNETHPERDFSILGASMENGVNGGALEVIYLP